jgi:hypothetical protein|tara:strand:- start:268 stop:555 length:288 start_codon:yes stop_codon:yes gene_type:complete
MKFFLGIVVFTLLFISIDLIKPNKVEACHAGWVVPRSHHSTFELLICKAESAVDSINPVTYFKNREKCQARADKKDTVAAGKKFFKKCMKRPSDY